MAAVNLLAATASIVVATFTLTYVTAQDHTLTYVTAQEHTLTYVTAQEHAALAQDFSVGFPCLVWNSMLRHQNRSTVCKALHTTSL